MRIILKDMLRRDQRVSKAYSITVITLAVAAFLAERSTLNGRSFIHPFAAMKISDLLQLSVGMVEKP